jgi:large subunit ribosomal protein L31
MKAKIHPTWYESATVVCACGNKFTVGATVPKLELEVCSNCHPFYTGQMKYVDTAGRVDAFKEKQKKAAGKVLSKSEKRKLKRQKREAKLQEELSRPDTLTELRSVTKKKKNKSKNS